MDWNQFTIPPKRLNNLELIKEELYASEDGADVEVFRMIFGSPFQKNNKKNIFPKKVKTTVVTIEKLLSEQVNKGGMAIIKNRIEHSPYRSMTEEKKDGLSILEVTTRIPSGAYNTVKKEEKRFTRHIPIQNLWIEIDAEKKEDLEQIYVLLLPTILSLLPKRHRDAMP